MSKKVKIKAAPGRVILQFPEQKETTTASGLIERVEEYVQIIEIATVVSVGEPTDEEERKYAAYFRERQKNDEGVLASYAAGESFWRETYDKTKWGWLKSIRAYRLSSPTAHLEIEEAAE